MLEKTPESPLDRKEIKSVNLKGHQPWIFVGRTDAEADAPAFWSYDAKSRVTGKVPCAGKDWAQKEERESEDEMAGWHYWCNGHVLGQTSDMVRKREACRTAVHGLQGVGHDWATEQQHEWFDISYFIGCPSWHSGKESLCVRRHKRHGCDPWGGKIPWSRKWQPTPVFLPGESPWREKPDRLQSMGWQRVQYDWAYTHTYTATLWMYSWSDLEMSW